MALRIRISARWPSDSGSDHAGDSPPSSSPWSRMPRVAFFLELAQACPENLRGTACAGPRGRGAGDEHEVSKNAVSTLGLAEDDTERSLGFGVVGAAEQQLRPADDHGQGIVELMAGTRGELGERFELVILEPGLLVTDLLPESRHDGAEPPLQDRGRWATRLPRPARQVSRPRLPAVRDQVGLAAGSHQRLTSGKTSPRSLQRNHECRRPFLALGRCTRSWLLTDRRRFESCPRPRQPGNSRPLARR